MQRQGAQKNRELTFHKDLSMPKNAPKTIQLFETPRISKHAEDQMNDRGIALTKEVLTQTFEVIELTIDEATGKACKYLVRGKSAVKGQDICLVFRTEFKSLALVTVWLNSSSDLHATLDETKYAHAG